MEGFYGSQLLVEEFDEGRVKRVVGYHGLAEVLTGSAIWQHRSAPAVHVHIRVRCLTRSARIDTDKQTLGKHPGDLSSLDRDHCHGIPRHYTPDPCICTLSNAERCFLRNFFPLDLSDEFSESLRLASKSICLTR